MERGENVLVVAHTSAGKTAIAEYAIARALSGGDRSVPLTGRCRLLLCCFCYSLSVPALCVSASMVGVVRLFGRHLSGVHCAVCILE